MTLLCTSNKYLENEINDFIYNRDINIKHVGIKITWHKFIYRKSNYKMLVTKKANDDISYVQLVVLRRNKYKFSFQVDL